MKPGRSNPKQVQYPGNKASDLYGHGPQNKLIEAAYLRRDDNAHERKYHAGESRAKQYNRYIIHICGHCQNSGDNKGNGRQRADFGGNVFRRPDRRNRKRAGYMLAFFPKGQLRP